MRALPALAAGRGLLVAAAASALAAAVAGGAAPAAAGGMAALAALLAGGALAALRAHERELARRQRALAIGLAHHVRTPLALVRMLNEMMLLGRERSEEERRQWLHQTARELQRLGDLTENFLLVSQAPDAQAFPARRPTDLGHLVCDVVADLDADPGGAPRVLADPPAGVCVLADPGALRQALVNVVEGALQQACGEPVAVSLRADGDDARLTVTARGGAPIRPRDRERIWEPFARLDSRAGAEHGEGLGLAVASRIVRAHGGRAFVEDAPGGGTRFCLALPLAAGTLDTAAPAR